MSGTSIIAQIFVPLRKYSQFYAENVCLSSPKDQLNIYTIGVAPGTCIIKIVTFKGDHLIW